MTDSDGGQAAVIDRLRVAIDERYDRAPDERSRHLLRALLERIRWWRIVSARFDAAEAAVRAHGFGLAEDSEDPLVPDLVGYYIYGDIVLDHLAAVALDTDAEGAWIAWLRRLDGETSRSTVRDLARDLDLMLRVTRNVLAVHRRPLHVSTVGVSAPGATTIDAFDLGAFDAAEASTELGALLRRHGLGLAPDALEQLDVLAHHGNVLEQPERDAFRRWAKKVGMRSVAPNEVTWRVVALARAL